MTGGCPITSQMLVIDVGGGSTEFVVVGPDGSVATTGLPLGAARLTKDLVRSDPPSLAEIESLKTTVRAILATAPDAHPGELVAVGGTASNLLRLLPATALDRVLTRRRLTVALAMLTVERSLEAAERHLVRPARARILPAGAIIVDAILEHYAADRLRVSEEGIREGLALAVAAAGPAWRDRSAADPRLGRGRLAAGLVGDGRAGPRRGGAPGRGTDRAGESGATDTKGGCAGPGARRRAARGPRALRPAARARAGTRATRPRASGPDGPPQPGDLVLAVDQVAADRRALGLRQVAGVLDQEGAGQRRGDVRVVQPARGGPGARRPAR